MQNAGAPIDVPAEFDSPKHVFRYSVNAYWIVRLLMVGVILMQLPNFIPDPDLRLELARMSLVFMYSCFLVIFVGFVWNVYYGVRNSLMALPDGLRIAGDAPLYIPWSSVDSIRALQQPGNRVKLAVHLKSGANLTLGPFSDGRFLPSLIRRYCKNIESLQPTTKELFLHAGWPLSIFDWVVVAALTGTTALSFFSLQ